jgi:hypothetical protein
MDVLEAVLVAAMIFITLFFVQGLNITVYEGVREKNIIRDLGISALESEDNKPASGYNSQLVEYLMTNDTANFSQTIFNKIFPSISFKVYLYNISRMFSDSVFKNSDYLWYEMESPYVGEGSQAYRIFVHDGYIYEIVLQMWYL